MAPKAMAPGQERVIEIVGRVVAPADSLHDRA
jgi:hypothetical protein